MAYNRVDFITCQFTSNPENLPAAWPAQSAQVMDTDSAPPANWQRVTIPAWNQYIIDNQAAYDAAVATKRAAAPVQTGTVLLRESRHAQQTLDFGAIAGGSSADLVMSVPGARLRDAIMLGIPDRAMALGVNTSNIVFMAWVSSPGNVTVRCMNNAAPAINSNPMDGVFTVICTTVEPPQFS